MQDRGRLVGITVSRSILCATGGRWRERVVGEGGKNGVCMSYTQCE